MEPTNEPLDSGENVEAQVADAEGGTNPNPVSSEPMAQDVSPAPEVVEEEPLTFSMPGEQRPQNEENWYKQQYATLANQLAEAQRQLEDFQMSGLDDDERRLEEFNRDRKRWQGEVEAWRNQQAVQQWGDYWAQFSDDPKAIKAMQDPIQMGHTVATNLYSELKKAKAEIASLKKATSKPAAGPPVTTGGQGTAGVRSLFSMTREEREALMHRARMGKLKDGDIPPLK